VKNHVGDKIKAERANWKFDADTVKGFDRHIEKSVPLYIEGHSLICDISDFFVKDGSIVASTYVGKILIKLLVSFI